MNKELLNKILPYCGYGLKVAFEDNITNTGPGDLIRLCDPDEHGEYFKPVLFPIDCLTREIETEYGKEVPVIEMAKIAFPYSEFRIEDGWAIDKSRLRIMFTFDGYDFQALTRDYITGKNNTSCITNQWELFQHFYSRHIAFNLEPDEYVSVESLEKNPYAE